MWKSNLIIQKYLLTVTNCSKKKFKFSRWSLSRYCWDQVEVCLASCSVWFTTLINHNKKCSPLQIFFKRILHLQGKFSHFSTQLAKENAIQYKWISLYFKQYEQEVRYWTYCGNTMNVYMNVLNVDVINLKVYSENL